MTTFYLDVEGGNDASDGLSFANRWKTFTSGATAARIAPGDTIRVMGSPAPTSLGMTATWTNGPMPAAKNIVSSTNATPIVMTVTGHGYANGDTVMILSHTTNTNAVGVWEIANQTANTFELVGSTGNGVGGATGTVSNINNRKVKLNAALTQTVASHNNIGEGRTAWTASASVTATLSSTTKQADVSDSIAVAAAFTTGKAAYKATGTLNLSGYKQISFWIQQTVGTVIVAGDVQFRLCSDVAGVTTVNTIAIPALDGTTRWTPFTVDTGAALGASIQSIAFDVNVDRGAQTFLISNIIACKDSTSADSITLSSLIGKNTTGETWYGVQSIVGTRLLLDQIPTLTSQSTSNRGYTGTTETVTTYKRETVKPGVGVTSTITDSGTSGSPITYSGGWDRTNMSSQTLETWLDGQTGIGTTGISAGNTFNVISNFAAVRYLTGFAIGGVDNIATLIAANNCNKGIAASGTRVSITCPYIMQTGHTQAGITDAGNNSNLTFGKNYNAANTSINIGTSGGASCTINTGYDVRNAFSGILITGLNSFLNSPSVSYCDDSGITIQSFTTIISPTITNNIGYAISGGASARVYSLVSSGNTLGGVRIVSTPMRLFNSTISEGTQISVASQDYYGYVSTSIKHDATADNHRIYVDQDTIFSDATTRHTASGISWKYSVLNSGRLSTSPLKIPVATIPCAASVARTVKLWFYRSNANMIGLLRIRGGQIGGVSADVSSITSGSASTWEQLSITFTPSEAGVVDIEAGYYTTDGALTYTGYIDDFSVTPSLSGDTGSLDYAYIGTGTFVGYQGAASAGGSFTFS
jgi:hypothetical protein